MELACILRGETKKFPVFIKIIAITKKIYIKENQNFYVN